MAANLLELPWGVIVRRVDPDHDRKARHELEYQFSNGRRFYRNPADFGPYQETDVHIGDFDPRDFDRRDFQTGT